MQAAYACSTAQLVPTMVNKDINLLSSPSKATARVINPAIRFAIRILTALHCSGRCFFNGWRTGCK